MERLKYFIEIKRDVKTIFECLKRFNSQIFSNDTISKINTFALFKMESLDESYGKSLEGISSTAGIGLMWASMTWRISSATQFVIGIDKV